MGRKVCQYLLIIGGIENQFEVEKGSHIFEKSGYGYVRFCLTPNRIVEDIPCICLDLFPFYAECRHYYCINFIDITAIRFLIVQENL